MSIAPAESAPIISEDLNPAPEEQSGENTENLESKPEAKPEPKQDDFLAPKFAALTRKEKQVREQAKALKAREVELEAKMKDLEAKLAAANPENYKAKIKANPLTALKDEFGLTFEQLAELQLNEGNPTVEMQLQRMREEIESKTSGEVESLKRMLAAKEEAAAQKQYDEAVSAYKTGIQAAVEQNPDKYELINANGATDLVFDVADQYFQAHNRVPALDEVLDAVEAHLEDEAKKIFELKKFKTQTSPKPNPTKTAPTLSNTDAITVPQKGGMKLTDEESKREAAKMIRWED